MAVPSIQENLTASSSVAEKNQVLAQYQIALSGLVSNTTYSINEKRQFVAEYYDFVARTTSDPVQQDYARLATSVAQQSDVTGRIAVNFLKNNSPNTTFSEQRLTDLSLSLAMADTNLRANANSNPSLDISAGIVEYHGTVFDSFGTNKNAWTGTFLVENSGNPSAFILSGNTDNFSNADLAQAYNNAGIVDSALYAASLYKATKQALNQSLLENPGAPINPQDYQLGFNPLTLANTDFFHDFLTALPTSAERQTLWTILQQLFTDPDTGIVDGQIHVMGLQQLNEIELSADLDLTLPSLINISQAVYDTSQTWLQSSGVTSASYGATIIDTLGGYGYVHNLYVGGTLQGPISGQALDAITSYGGRRSFNNPIALDLDGDGVIQRFNKDEVDIFFGNGANNNFALAA